MSTTDEQVDHLLVTQSVFAGDRFWAALDRLAQRLGHDGHQRFLRGVPEPTNWYEFCCVPCDRVIATMAVQRDHPQQGQPTPAAQRGR